MNDHLESLTERKHVLWKRYKKYLRVNRDCTLLRVRIDAAEVTISRLQIQYKSQYYEDLFKNCKNPKQRFVFEKSAIESCNFTQLKEEC